MHGLPSILQRNAMTQLALGETVLSSAVEHMMDMVDAALVVR